MMWNRGEVVILLGVSILLFLAQISNGQTRENNTSRVKESFNVYWNVPTFLCKGFSDRFESELKRFGLIVNQNDKFRGEKIVILYDPGMFPIVLKNVTSKTIVEHNGGIPQLGNFTAHILKFQEDVDQLVPRNFSGLGIIDFEVWRPVYRQNWNAQTTYKTMSMELEEQKHPFWPEKWVQEEAKRNFEASAKLFMEGTLKTIKRLRPFAQWGYYGFPYCMNHKSSECPKIVEQENDRIRWLFKESTALYPSVYMSKKVSGNELREKVDGRLREARRVASTMSANGASSVYPYVWYRYHDSKNYLTHSDMKNTIQSAKNHGLGGVIIWGSYRDVKTTENCNNLLNYVTTTLGPIVKEVKNSDDKFTWGFFGGLRY